LRWPHEVQYRSTGRLAPELRFVIGMLLADVSGGFAPFFLFARRTSVPCGPGALVFRYLRQIDGRTLPNRPLIARARCASLIFR
jgi:hypothetical protein